MRRLTPNPNNGIVGIQSVRPTTFVNAKAYNKPNKGLSRLDQLRNGGAPEIIVTRCMGGAGDVLMTLPTVRAVAEKYKCKVDYATDFTYLDGILPNMVQGLPYIRNVLNYHNIVNENYDSVLDLTCPCIVHEKPGADPINRIDLFARHLGIVLTNHKIDFIHTEEELTKGFEILNDLRIDIRKHKVILVQPSSSTTRRDFPLDTLKQVVRKVSFLNNNIRIIVLTHGSDSYQAQQNRWQDINSVSKIHDLKARNIAGLMSYVDLVLCPDSLILHLAGALNKPTFAFFGPTDARARINYYPNAIAISGSHGLKCQNCWYNPCPANQICWKRIDVDLSVQVIDAMLHNKKVPQSPELVHFGTMPVGSSTAYETL